MNTVPKRYVNFYNLYVKPHIKDKDHINHFEFMQHSFHSKETSYIPSQSEHTSSKKVLCSICFNESICDEQDHSICKSCGFSSYKNDVSVLHDGSGTIYKRQKFFIRMINIFEKKTNIPKWDTSVISLSLQESKKKYKQYYLDIYCLFHSIPKPEINSGEKKILLSLFDQFVHHFNNMRKEKTNSFLEKRKNFLNYSLVCHALFTYIKRDDCCQYLFLPAKTKQDEQLPIIQNITDKLNL